MSSDGCHREFRGTAAQARHVHATVLPSSPRRPCRRWQLPLLLALTAVLLVHVPDSCASPLLQHGYLLLNTGLRLLTPLLVPGALFAGVNGWLSYPREGAAAATAFAAVAADPAGSAARCRIYQATCALATCAALAVHAYRSEKRRRLGFRRRRGEHARRD